LEIAHEMPQSADSIGRYLRFAAQPLGADSANRAAWDQLVAWFAHYQKQDWARVGWATSQFALMFPASLAHSETTEIWTEWLESGNQIQMVAIAAQRLAALDKSRCRDIIQGRMKHETDPVVLRVLALGYLTSGGDRRAVRAALDKDPRNVLVSKMLEARNWVAPAVSADFDSPVLDEVP
jgi:hypothetical protein